MGEGEGRSMVASEWADGPNVYGTFKKIILNSAWNLKEVSINILVSQKHVAYSSKPLNIAC